VSDREDVKKAHLRLMCVKRKTEEETLEREAVILAEELDEAEDRGWERGVKDAAKLLDRFVVYADKRTDTANLCENLANEIRELLEKGEQYALLSEGPDGAVQKEDGV
jgi:hypothetical protein